jgi:predicted KAP-like P-loop ATPase
MWQDSETATDLINFKTIANIAAEVIRESAGQPVSIGISGGWGAGKSSLVKMVGNALRADTDTRYMFVDFNAWLYQGFDDAKLALLQAVTDAISDYSGDNQTWRERVGRLISRVRWFRLAKAAAPVLLSGMTGAAVGGVPGALMGAAMSLASGVVPSAKDVADTESQIADGLEKGKEFIRPDEERSMPREIDAFRRELATLLSDLGVTLVVLVDDLDRCLPDTAISTLEAIRLLLFLDRTAFIIAADDEMIRHAVRVHFRDAEPDDDLVTSYFDKLIQIPIRVPRLGPNEVRAYMAQLFIEQAVRKREVTPEVLANASEQLRLELQKGFAGNGIDGKFLEDLVPVAAVELRRRVGIADELADVMTTAREISGNPRLVKRFMNAIALREAVGRAHSISVSTEVLAKLLLFERCAANSAMDELAAGVIGAADGKFAQLAQREDAVRAGDPDISLPAGWDTPFVRAWLKLEPALGRLDLRDALYLSRDRSISVTRSGKLSAEERQLLKALIDVKTSTSALDTRLKATGPSVAEEVARQLVRIKRQQNEWDKVDRVAGCFMVADVYPELKPLFVDMYRAIPAATAGVGLAAKLAEDTAYHDVLRAWAESPDCPQRLKKIFEARVKK